MPVHILDTPRSFEEAIQKHATVIIDFYATWCGPCRVLAPMIGKYSDDSKYKDVFFAKIDVEQLSDLSDKLEVFSMPTLILFKDGIKVETVVDPNGPALQAFLESSLV